MAFKKGHKPWNTGKKRPPMSEETRRKISLSGLGRKSPMKGKKISESHRKNISLSLIGNKRSLGRRLSEETKKKIGANGFHYGMLGKKMSGESKKKISDSHKGKHTGESSNFWRGGTSSVSKRIRTHPRHKKWREAVFERDNYTCQYCGLHSGCGKTVELHPHHIISFSSILNKLKFQFGIDNLFENAIKCELLWDISNGITLCSDCHHKTDNYGRPYAS